MPHTQMMEERLEFLNIDGNALSELRIARDILEPEMDAMLDRFYEHILAEPDLQALFVNKDDIDHARSAQKNHWLKTMFDGKYDSTYFEKAAQIGRAHFRIGLTPNWYIGGYCQMLVQFIELLSNKYADKGESAAQIIQAVSKAVFLDMDLVIHCYLDAKEGSTRQVLRRATDFAGDVTALNDELNVAATKIKATAEKLSAEARGERGTTTTTADEVSEHVVDSSERINELLAQAEDLNRQTTQLDERLKELQFRDKLYFDENPPQSGTFSRLKALVLGQK